MSRLRLAYNRGDEIKSIEIDAPDLASLKSGGGDGTSGGMDLTVRVSALEEGQRALVSELAALRLENAKGFADLRVTLVEQLSPIRSDIAGLKAKIEGMPTAIAFGEVKGAVSRIPGTITVSGILGLCTAAIIIANNWATVKVILHL